MYSIKEVSKLLNINANAIRFYEKKNLIQPERKDNQYRMYSMDDIGRLQTIMLYRKMGFSIEAIATILNNQNLLEVFTAQYNRLNEHIHAMMHIRETMSGCVENMLNQSSINETTLAQMTKTAELISASNQWQDQWHFDDWAADYDVAIRKHDGGLDFYAHYDLVLETTMNQVKSEMSRVNASEQLTVTEVGIGTGNLARRIIDEAEGKVHYIGVDQSLNMLKQAKRKCPESEVRMGTFLQLPLNAHTADVIVTSYAFHHCNEMERQLAIKEMHRVLKTNGKIVITDLMFKDQIARDEFETSCTEAERIDLEDEFFTTVDEIEGIFKQLGYTVSSEQVDDIIWVISAMQKG